MTSYLDWDLPVVDKKDNLALVLRLRQQSQLHLHTSETDVGPRRYYPRIR
jgi:hypothetical protein